MLDGHDGRGRRRQRRQRRTHSRQGIRRKPRGRHSHTQRRRSTDRRSRQPPKVENRDWRELSHPAREPPAEWPRPRRSIGHGRQKSPSSSSTAIRTLPRRPCVAPAPSEHPFGTISSAWKKHVQYSTPTTRRSRRSNGGARRDPPRVAAVLRSRRIPGDGNAASIGRGRAQRRARGVKSASCCGSAAEAKT